MKSFTDIEQSKKLAEILPLESADMSWKHYVPDSAPEGYSISLDTIEYDTDIPCWSLAALIGALPRYLKCTEGRCPLNLFTLDFENPYRKDHCWVVGYSDYDEEYEEYNFQMEAREDEAIDACYELIFKLHEHKLI